ncbi:MAG: hypothetical protein KDE19_14840 [Caldilineaceae bacterium]|nr:hypothetical protein [Caldilineaceae bacterium]
MRTIRARDALFHAATGYRGPRRLRLLLILCLFATSIGTQQIVTAADPLPPIIFVARGHLATQDTIFEEEVGPAGQFGTGLPKFAPGSKLVRRNADGSLFVYETPGLVDVQSPDVNFDGTRIIFAGTTTLIPDTDASGWRLYEINVDGSGLRQLTHSDRSITIPHADRFFNQRTYGTYDDLFPAYLADGRIVFASTRYPARAHYDARRVTNLYVMNGDGTDLHRISSERGGMLHPTPLPDGRVLVTRWWVNFNQPTETGLYNRVDNQASDQTLTDGTRIYANPDEPFNPATGELADGFAIRDAPNSWHLMTLHPDGSNFQRFAWTPWSRYTLDRDNGFYDTYHATQPAIVQQGDETFVAYTSQQDSTMVHTTLKTGIRVARPGVDLMYANTGDAVAGLTYEKAWEQDDESPPYALHPWGLSDGRILYSQTVVDESLPRTGTHTEGGHVFDLQGSNLRYVLHTMDLDGGNKTAVDIDLSTIGMADADMMDAKPIVARTGWTALTDTYTATASDDPTLGNLPNTMDTYRFSQHGPNQIATATIHNNNIYANAALTLPYVNNSPPPGSVATVEVWVDANQFTGAYCYNDYPEPCADFRNDAEQRAVLWGTADVTPVGAFTMTVPADTPSFFVLRDQDGRIVRNWQRGYMSIAQGNAWARPSENVTCTGCHMGHVSGTIAANQSEASAGWTNVAPYASVNVSNFYAYNNPDSPNYQPFRPHFLNDRHGWVPTPADGPAAPFRQNDSSFLNYRALLAKVGISRNDERTTATSTARATAPRGTIPQTDQPPSAVQYQDDESSWMTEEGRAAGEWVQLTWTTPMRVNAVRLVGVPPVGGDWEGFGEPAEKGPYFLEKGTLQFYRNGAQQGASVAVGRVEPLSAGGTLVTLAQPLEVDEIRFTITEISGQWWYNDVAALSEIEVIGMAATAMPLPPLDLPEKLYLPSIQR